MGPLSAFRRLADIATRWPKLVAVLGFGLVAEGARVVWTMKTAGAVALIGHSGPSSLDAEADRPFLLLYVVWVTLSGVLLLTFARRGERARKRRTIATAARTAAARPSAQPPLGPSRSPEVRGGARPVIERRPRTGD